MKHNKEVFQFADTKQIKNLCSKLFYEIRGGKSQFVQTCNNNMQQKDNGFISVDLLFPSSRAKSWQKRSADSY